MNRFLNILIYIALCNMMLDGVFSHPSDDPALVDLRKRLVNAPILNRRYPWLVSLQSVKRNYRHFCGGSLLSENIAITAAHCLEPLNRSEVPNAVIASANRFDISKKASEEGGVDFTIINYIIHPNYNPDKQFMNDIALILLEPTNDTAKNLDKLSFVKLDRTDGGLVNIDRGSIGDRVWDALENIGERLEDVDTSNPLNENLMAAGWGSIKPDKVVPSDKLRGISMVITREDRCLNSLGLYQTRTVICAKGKKSRTDTCRGDSGTALFVDKGGSNQILVGITSFGVGCAATRTRFLVRQVEYPGVYSSATYYTPWIKRTSELMIASISPKKKEQLANTNPKLPSISNGSPKLSKLT